MRRRAISFLSRWPPTNLTIILSATTKRGVIYLVWRGGRLVDKLSFPALQLTCTRALSYIWRISLPLTHFLLLLPAQDSEFHIFLPFEGWQVCSKPLFVHSVAAQKFPLVAFVYLLQVYLRSTKWCILTAVKFCFVFFYRHLPSRASV